MTYCLFSTRGTILMTEISLGGPYMPDKLLFGAAYYAEYMPEER